MKIAIVMPTWIRQHRVEYADKCFPSFLMTVKPANVDLALLLLVKSGIYTYPFGELRRKCWLTVDQQEKYGFRGCDQPMVFGCELACDMGADILIQLGDDTLFHPLWLVNLQETILKYPDARAWSVCRSANTAIHRTLREEGDHVFVASINGNGLTLSSEEWASWGLRWQDANDWEEPYWRSPQGHKTLDMHHVEARPGHRVVTRSSYIEHIGYDGTWCKPGSLEHAMNFVGS